MGLIRVQDVVKQYGPQMVLRGVTLEFDSSQRVGLVGANGAGKTTLLKIIAGAVAPDEGTVTVSKGTLVGYLPQEPQLEDSHTLHDHVMGAFADLLAMEERIHHLADQLAAAPPGPQQAALMNEHARATARFDAAGGYGYEQRLAEILGGLGFSESDQRLPVTVLSGGQKCRAALARLLLNDAEFLLLDEPTNHLDIDAVRWLEKFLAGHRGGAVIISHDRYLLDRVADRIVEIDDGRARSYPGDYTSYVRTRELRALTQDRQFEKDRTFIQKEQEFIRRHMGSQRTSEARGRRTRLERRLAAGEFVTRRAAARAGVRIDFSDQDAGPREGEIALELAGLTKSYGARELFRDLDLQLLAGQRLGITGPNGTGKTTLLRIVLGQTAPDAGNARLAPKVRPGYFAQDVGDLDPGRTVVQEIIDARPAFTEAGARDYAARFLFRGDDPFKRVEQLSGGEQSRVRLMKLILRSPNMLILDEPTNHLDIPSREVLEDALSDFPGTIIAVSHDRYFLDRICNRLLVMRPGAVQAYGGNYTDYVRLIETPRAAPAADTRQEEPRPAGKSPARPSAPHAEDGPPRDVSPSGPAASARPPSRRAKPWSRWGKMTLSELEAEVTRRGAQLEALQARYADPAVYQDRGALARLEQEIHSARAELAEAEEEWLARCEPT